MDHRKVLLSPALLLAVSFLTPAVHSQESPNKGILDLSETPHAKLHNVSVSAVTVHEGFWFQRRKVNEEKSIPTLYDLLEANGIIDNFRRLVGKDVERKGPLYTDSDLYKWMEAAAFVLQYRNDPELRARMETLVDIILAAQEPSDYLNTYYQDERKDLRWTEQHRGHELYCLGHLLQAAIAYYRATGERRLLDGATKFVDYLVETSGSGKRPLLTGHPELEMALVELYRVTRNRKHLELAGYLLNGDGRMDLRSSQLIYMFSGKPFTSRTKLEGHAVRAMYACSGATDYYMETAAKGYWNTIQRLWDDMVSSKMYITGGVGSRSSGEAFGDPYELPNVRAYTESCAAIGNMFWNWRLLAVTGDAKYADVLERALYNSVNSGLSLSGTLYCYRNPLELVGDPEDKIRNPWYSTTCCPPNLERVLASLPGYFYSTSSEGLYVHLYDNNTLEWKLENGTDLKLIQSTNYPWENRVAITVDPAQPCEFTLFLRIPSWTDSGRIWVNGEVVSGQPKPGQYLPLQRQWTAGDEVTLEFGMEPQLISANPRVREDYGRVAVQRGPLVYTIEGIDQPDVSSIFDLQMPVSAQGETEFQVEHELNMLGGVVVLRHPGLVPLQPLREQPLYQRLNLSLQPKGREITLTFVPYYTFANREPTPMQVWIPHVRQ